MSLVVPHDRCSGGPTAVTNHPVMGLAKLMDDPEHGDFIRQHLLCPGSQEAILMFLSFYQELQLAMPHATTEERATILQNAVRDRGVRTRMIKLWKDGDVSSVRKLVK